jgi:hypothetical protein
LRIRRHRNLSFMGTLILSFVLGYFSLTKESQAIGQSSFTSFIGAGMNFTFPATIRLGSGSWEFGMLSPGFLGASEYFSLTPKTYSSFGLGINADGSPTGVGFQAGIGFYQELFWDIGFRAEMMARTNSNGASNAHGLAGLSYGF